VSHPEIQHKSDIGGVVLGIEDPHHVEVAAEQLLALRPGATVLVEAMAAPGVEMLVSATRDGVVPSLVVGLGGVWTELLADVVVVPLPADPERIAAALPRLTGYPLLAGARGVTPVHIEALCTLASAVSRVLLDERLSLVELNPVLVSATGAVAVDAVVRR
jgi:acetyltransferase